MRRKYAERTESASRRTGAGGPIRHTADFKVLDLPIAARPVSLRSGHYPVRRCTGMDDVLAKDGAARDAVPFLEHALVKAYDHRDFFGGRGLAPSLTGNGMLYENDVEESSSWRRFRGREKSSTATTNACGWLRISRTPPRGVKRERDPQNSWSRGDVPAPFFLLPAHDMLQ